MVLTHDRRVRVFVSSTLNEAAAERRAARAAIEALHLTPVMFDLGARPYPPQQLYRSYLEQSDVFIGIYADQYGWIGPGAEVSGLEDEFLLSGDRPKLMYLKSPAPERDPRLTGMIERIWATAGTSTSNYTDAEQLGRLIADDLAVLLSERFAGAEVDRSAELHGPGVVTPPAPATELVGREAELAGIGDLLRRPEVRLVTLTGLGGIGKTRLALEVARAADERFPTTAFADLAPLTGADQVPAAIAAALGIVASGGRDPLDVIADRIGDRPVLLVLDNVEHVVAAAPVVARLLTRCPRLVLLATSRTALRIRAEHEVPIGPLATPPAPPADDGSTRADPSDIETSPAVALFVARAQQVRPGFRIDAGNAADLAQIARRLEGIPLAIELAAARARLLPPATLLARLGDMLDLRAADVDVPDRQHTLRCTIGWSFDLLSADERDALEQLSVFPASGWSLEAAEDVVVLPPDADLLEALSELIQHSLVVAVDAPSGPRFRTFETVRAFAAQKLLAADGREAPLHRLADHVCTLGVRASEQAGRPEGRIALTELDAELDAIRTVLRWSVDSGQADLAIRVGGSLSRYLWSRAMLGELADLVERTAAMPSATKLGPAQRARLVWSQGSIALAVGRLDDARPLLEEALFEAQQLAEDSAEEGPERRWLLPHALFSLGIALPYEQQAGRMRELLGEALTRFERRDDTWGMAVTLIPLGEIALRDGDVPAATRLHERALREAERNDDDHVIAQCLNQLALDAFLGGAADDAGRYLARAGRIYRTLPDQEGLAYCLDGFAAVHVAAGRTRQAAELIGTADRVREIAGVVVWPLMKPLADQFSSAVETMLGAADFAAARAAGAGTPPLVALEHQLSPTPPPR